MIDLHCHILPGLDDGPSSMDESIEMARIAHQDGIRTIVATPHIQDNTPSPEQIASIADSLSARIAAVGLDMDIFPGAEIQAHCGPLSAQPYAINGGRYVLVEIRNNIITMATPDLLFNYVSQGLIPILCHLERSPSTMRLPDMLAKFIGMGCLIQITASSLTDTATPESKACCLYMLKNNLVHIIATDGHSASWRPPVMSEALKTCSRIIGEKATSVLVNDNPLKIIHGECLN